MFKPQNNKIEKQVTQEHINEILELMRRRYQGRRLIRGFISGFPHICGFPDRHQESKTIKYTVDYPSRNILVEELIIIYYEDECFYRWDGEDYNEPTEFRTEWRQIELIIFTDTNTALALLEESIKRKWLGERHPHHPNYDPEYFDDESPSLWFDDQLKQYCLDDIPLCNIPE
jgi:hypothetical protein